MNILTKIWGILTILMGTAGVAAVKGAEFLGWV